MPRPTPPPARTAPSPAPHAPGFGVAIARCPAGICAAGAVREGVWTVGPSVAMHARESDLASPAPRSGVSDFAVEPAAHLGARARDLLPPVAGAGLAPGVWIGAIAYDASARYEPRTPVPGEPDTPASVWHRVAILPGNGPDPATDPEIRRKADPRAEPFAGPGPSPGPGWVAGPVRSATGREGFLSQVRRALEYIRAGDIYQVNLTHRLEVDFEGDPRALARDLVAHANPRHGVYLEYPRLSGARGDLPPGVVVSVSPERFLRSDAPSRRVITQPMKGTRPIGADPDELDRADKDRAELAMIVDLMRNDLGRVCAPGTVRVDRARRIDAHAGSVWQATAEVSGTLREGLGAADLLAASFPPGSVTGAPKVRATQIIAELEPVARGFYCGCAGVIDDAGSLDLNVAIRTAQLVRKDEGEFPGPGRYTLRFSVGGGIVADSDPDAEWAETMDKAEVLMRTLGANPGTATA